jgi:hypothetical protein
VRYWTASEEEHDVTHWGLLGRRVPPGGPSVPAGVTHAVHAETTTADGHTLCWELLGKLVLWRHTDFESSTLRASPYVALCELCLEYVAEDGR